MPPARHCVVRRCQQLLRVQDVAAFVARRHAANGQLGRDERRAGVADTCMGGPPGGGGGSSCRPTRRSSRTEAWRSSTPSRRVSSSIDLPPLHARETHSSTYKKKDNNVIYKKKRKPCLS